MPFFNRASREYNFVPGMGGSIEVQQYSTLGVLLPARTIIDIEQYILRNIYVNRVTTHSGSSGATLRTRVGADWDFVARLSAPQESFVELLLGHWRSVACIFNVGDPLWYSSQNLEIRTYRATKALLAINTITTDSKGTEVVKLDVHGEGNSLLWGYEGEVPISTALWP